VQTDATYTGTDFDIRYRLTSNLTAIAKSSVLLVKDVKNNSFIYGIPAQQANARLNYTFASLLGIENGHLWLNAAYTANQNRVEPDEDFDETPDAYFLVNAELGGQVKNSPLHFNLGVKNLLNTSYRDYLNRYRYYADDVGLNIYLSLNFTFQ
jgi:iron complex outermembrane receptor protein